MSCECLHHVPNGPFPPSSSVKIALCEIKSERYVGLVMYGTLLSYSYDVYQATVFNGWHMQ